jgi:hypothetical protein
MRVFENKTLKSLYDQESGAVFADMEFRSCDFESCVLSMAGRPARRSTVRNVRLLHCSQRGCRANCAVFEDVLIDDLATNGQLLQTFGAVFNRTVLRGKIDRLMLSNDVLPSILKDDSERQQEIEAFRSANAEFYRRVEWALDISTGEFRELDLRGIPGHLVRRDPETQVLVLRERALKMEWVGLDFKENLLPTTLQLFLEGQDSSLVYAAPKRHPKFRRYLDDVKLLRRAGIAEPD